MRRAHALWFAAALLVTIGLAVRARNAVRWRSAVTTAVTVPESLPVEVAPPPAPPSRPQAPAPVEREVALASCSEGLTLRVGNPRELGEQEARVLAATARELRLRTRDGDCVQPLDGRQLARAVLDAPSEPSVGAGVSQTELSSAITEREPNAYELDTSFVEAVLERAGTAVSEVELSADQAGARVTSAPGFFGYLGLQTGDVLQAANGRPVGSLDDLVAAFLDLGRSESMQLTLQRDGKPSALTYRAR